MSQIQIVDTIQGEIATIDKAQIEAVENKGKLRDFILSDDFLKKYREFDKLLSTWSDTLMSLVEATGTAFQGESQLPQQNKPKNENLLGEGMVTQVEGSDLTLAKALVLIIVNIGAVVLFLQSRYPIFDEYGMIVDYSFWVPWVVPVITVALSITLCFFRPITNFVSTFLKKEEEEEPLSLNALTNKISDSISYMRSEYVKRRFLLKFQKPDPQLKSRRNPYVDIALVDREAQTMEEMPSEFMSRIDTISVECNTAAFNRKQILYSYLRSYPQPQQQPMPVAH